MTDQEYLELQEDLKEEFDFVRETAIDFYHDFDLGDEHYRTEGDRVGIEFVFKHGNKFGGCFCKHGQSLKTIKQIIEKDHNFLTEQEILFSSKKIYNYLKNQDF